MICQKISEKKRRPGGGGQRARRAPLAARGMQGGAAGQGVGGAQPGGDEGRQGPRLHATVRPQAEPSLPSCRPDLSLRVMLTSACK